MSKQTLIYDNASQSIRIQETDHFIASRYQNRWICQPQREVGPELSAKLFMAMTYVHDLRWGTPEAVLPNLQMLVDVGDLVLTEQRAAPDNMSIEFNEYSGTIRLHPQNYLLAYRSPTTHAWICEPDPAVPHDIARKTFLLLQMKDDLSFGAGEGIARKLDTHILRRSADQDAEHSL